MKKLVILAVGLSVVLVTSASAFDGMRRGFVLGGGLGIAPTISWKSVYATAFKEDVSGVALNFFLGYAWDEQNMLVWETNIVGWESDWSNDDIAQGFGGASFYHYFGPVGKSAFIVGGLGLTMFQPEGFAANDAKAGILLGGGYEFTRHWQVAAYIMAGKTSVKGFSDYEHSHFSILINTVAF